MLRKDPLSGSWVIIAEERSDRIRDPLPEPVLVIPPDRCPFCEGHEGETPPEILAIRNDGAPRDEPGWRLRVVPNRYAALRIEGDLEWNRRGVCESMRGVSAHEVIIETPVHDARIGDYPLEKIEEILRVYRERSIDLHRDVRFRYIQIFRNYGSQAGASQTHPHSQLIALPIMPRWVLEELLFARSHYDQTRRCILCEILAQELEERERILDENEHFVAFAPFASKFSHETWILPRDHAHDFQKSSDVHLSAFARILKRVLWSLQETLGDPPFNYMLHTIPDQVNGPETADAPSYYHWHLEIIPRLTRVAGFEWGTGFHINPTPPERAAARLREMLEVMPERAAVVGSARLSP